MGNNMNQIQNQSHAIFNTCYVLAPNIGGIYMPGGEDFKFSNGKARLLTTEARSFLNTLVVEKRSLVQL
ncbi:MAG: hypothetical protein Ct9H90mP13_03390 [Pseudomonadota bacterium]|nr:MAG: hypothetical protein Ct9H90mP13_03390 [Pseudomonadota bacterium]